MRAAWVLVLLAAVIGVPHALTGPADGVTLLALLLLMAGVHRLYRAMATPRSDR